MVQSGQIALGTLEQILSYGLPVTKDKFDKFLEVTVGQFFKILE